MKNGEFDMLDRPTPGNGNGAGPGQGTSAAGIKSFLNHKELFRVSQLLTANTVTDSESKITKYHPGWDDKRILEILRKEPGRGHLQLRTIVAFRRENLGDLPKERRRGAYAKPADRPSAISRVLHDRMDRLEARNEKLEAHNNRLEARVNELERFFKEVQEEVYTRPQPGQSGSH